MQTRDSLTGPSMSYGTVKACGLSNKLINFEIPLYWPYSIQIYDVDFFISLVF